MSERVFAAIDLGASGGRVMAGLVDRGRITLHEVHRFPNEVHARDGQLRWDFTGLFGQILDGLGKLADAFPRVESIGIDTWAVDYGLLDAKGDLLAEPIAYRDDRTLKVIDDVHRSVSPEKLYAVNGLQFLPFNTLYQLAAEQRGPLWDKCSRVVLLPDLVAYWLTGELRTEATNASTTGLVDAHTGTWSPFLLDQLEIDASLLPPIEQPGAFRGLLKAEVATSVRLPATTVVTTVGSHDTASAYVGVPAGHRRSAFISSGTWSLVGLELDQPVISGESRAANFTNELGVDRRTRFLRNVGGLWLLQESIRWWRHEGLDVDLPTLTQSAAALPAGGPIFDVDDRAFLSPGDMPSRIAEAVGRPDMDPAATARSIIDSLARAYAATVEQSISLARQDVEVLHIVGGGSANELLCQLTADGSRLPVLAGPVEATALGNIAVQARALGALDGSLEEIRQAVAASVDLRRYVPS